MTKEDVLNSSATIFHENGCKEIVGPRGGRKILLRPVRRNGRVILWKTRPDEFRLPIRNGYYNYGYITQDNLKDFHLPENCPLAQKDS
jgi:hypothetical protein